MSEMIERVAIALLKAHDAQFGDGDFTDMARAAIEAMREPTPAMLYALNGCGGDTEAIWGAMIDAALGITK